VQGGYLYTLQWGCKLQSGLHDTLTEYEQAGSLKFSNQELSI
jgi:hypothetical protein